MSALLTVWAILNRIPREVWLILAALAALWAWGNHREAEGYADGKAHVQAKWDKAKAKDAERYQAAVAKLDAQSIAYEALAQSLRTAERTDRETIREVYRNVQVPANCAADPAVRSVLDNAVTRSNAAASGQSGGEVPPAP